MIIACPDCSGPYQLPDDDIAPLVQVACPHCTYRIILDFEAANDPRLVEPGMRVASGYDSEADYRRALAGPAAPAPETPAPATPPSTQPRPAPASVPPGPPATAAPLRSPAPVRAEAPASAPEAEESGDTGRTLIGQPPISIPPLPPGDRVKTPAPLELTAKLERAPEPEPEPEVLELGEPIAVEPEPEPEPEAIEEDVDEAPEPRRLPHTPPAAAASTPPAAEPARARPVAPTPAELSGADMSSPDVDDDEYEPARSHAVLYLFVGLLLIVAVLAGFSFYETGDPDPTPLIDELIRSYTG
jgi:DNA-directed RNA polymerase subunit RPC12/RpoP